GVNQTRVVLPREDGNELPERTLVQEVVHLTSIDDTTLHSHFDSQDERTFFKSLGSKSLIILPLSARGSVFGNITFISRTRIFDEGDLSFAKEIAEILGLSADNARLYEEAQAAIHS